MSIGKGVRFGLAGFIGPLLFGRMARRNISASAINILIIAARDGTDPYAGTLRSSSTC